MEDPIDTFFIITNEDVIKIYNAIFSNEPHVQLSNYKGDLVEVEIITENKVRHTFINHQAYVQCYDNYRYLEENRIQFKRGVDKVMYIMSSDSSIWGVIINGKIVQVPKMLRPKYSVLKINDDSGCETDFVQDDDEPTCPSTPNKCQDSSIKANSMFTTTSINLTSQESLCTPPKSSTTSTVTILDSPMDTQMNDAPTTVPTQTVIVEQDEEKETTPTKSRKKTKRVFKRRANTSSSTAEEEEETPKQQVKTAKEESSTSYAVQRKTHVYTINEEVAVYVKGIFYLGIVGEFDSKQQKFTIYDSDPKNPVLDGEYCRSDIYPFLKSFDITNGTKVYAKWIHGGYTELYLAQVDEICTQNFIKVYYFDDEKGRVRRKIKLETCIISDRE